MNVIELLILMIGIGLMNVLCFLIGARTGQKVANNKEVELPTINPIQAVKNYEQKREEEQVQKEYRDNLEAINNYDGNI